MKNNQKTLFQCLIIGLKVGWNAPVLSKVLNFHNNPLVRIFRVIGGLSVVTVLLKQHTSLYLPLQYLVLFLSFLHIIYIFIISIIGIIHGFKVLKSDKLNVKNSPLDRFASITGKLLYCWKVGCKVGSAGISLAGTSVIADTILEAGGQEKLFTPLLGKGVKFMIQGKSADSLFTEIDNDIKNIKDTKTRFDELKKLAEKCDWTDNSENGFSKQDSESIKSARNEAKKMEKAKLSQYAEQLAKKIKDYSDNNNNK